MNKRITALLLALILLLSISCAACSSDVDTQPKEDLSTAEPTAVPTQGMTDAYEQTLPAGPDADGTTPTEEPTTDPNMGEWA
ncbi:MAG: hypothetical protein IKB09_02395 [Oscillospiraceae bacterium]|nr:hypothetical protein [Oscillospiraceae bacterium]